MLIHRFAGGVRAGRVLVFHGGMGSTADRRLEAVARRSHGVFTTAEADGCGVPRSTVRDRIATGAYRRLFPGVLTHGSTPDSYLLRLTAAARHVGGEACLSRMTAADLHGIPGARRPDRIHVLVTARTFERTDTNTAIRVHRTDYFLQDHITERGGLSVTTVERTLCDVAHATSYARLRSMVAGSVRTGLATAASIRTTIDDLGRFRGKRKLVPLVDELSPLEATADSGLESLFLRVTTRHGIPPTAMNHRITDAHGHTRYLDAVYLPERLPVELDGRSAHGTLVDWHDDLRRENAVVLGGGWHAPLRYSWDDLQRRPTGVCAEIERALTAIRSSTQRALPQPP